MPEYPLQLRRGPLAGVPALAAGELVLSSDQYRLLVGDGAAARVLGVQHKLDATAAPGVGDDAADGFSPGSLWVDVTGDTAYVCVDSIAGAAVWSEVGGGGGGGGGTVTSVNLTAPAAGITVSGGPITTSGSITLALADDLAAVEGLATTGLVRRTAANTWTAGTAIATAEIANDAVDNTKLRNSAALSVIGRSANSTGDPADIAAGTDGHVLRRSGTSLGFGTLASGAFSNNTVAPARVAFAASPRLLGRTTAGAGQGEEITVGTGLSLSGGALACTVAAGTPIPAGALMAFAMNAVPSGWLACNGAAVSRTTYGDLFAAIGTTYSPGDGSTTFGVPNLQRRTLIGSGGTQVSGPATTVGSTGGTETHTLSTAEIPVHNHGVTAIFRTANVTGNGGGFEIGDAGSSSPGATATTSSGGGGQHNNMQPSMTVLWCIKT